MVSINTHINQETELITESEFRERIKEMKFPYLRFSVVRDCNAACNFCHNEGQEGGKKGKKATQGNSYLSLDKISYISNFFKESFSKVKFTGGEPTLAANLEEIVNIFYNDGYGCSITTNAFIFNKQKQINLKKAGLTSVNISLSSIDFEGHGKYFCRKGILNDVLENINSLKEIYGDNVKINFMDIQGDSLLNDVYDLSILSGKLGIPISYLSIISGFNVSIGSKKMISYIDKVIGIDYIESFPDRFVTKECYHLKNGAIWEIDDFRRKEYQDEALNNSYCGVCSITDDCIEGPYALRISYDGSIRQCLIRTDNLIPLKEKGYLFKEVKNKQHGVD